MGVFHVFKIVQIVPNWATHHRCVRSSRHQISIKIILPGVQASPKPLTIAKKSFFINILPFKKVYVREHYLIIFSTLSWRRSLSHRNQSNDLLCKSMGQFLYDRNLRHERYKDRSNLGSVSLRPKNSCLDHEHGLGQPCQCQWHYTFQKELSQINLKFGKILLKSK